MDLLTVKVILALAAAWVVPAKHGDISNAYVNDNKEGNLQIYLKMPQGMSVSDETLREQGVKSKAEMVFRAP